MPAIGDGLTDFVVERRDRWNSQKPYGPWAPEPNPLPPIADLLSRKGIDLITIERDRGTCTQYRLQGQK